MTVVFTRYFVQAARHISNYDSICEGMSWDPDDSPPVRAPPPTTAMAQSLPPPLPVTVVPILPSQATASSVGHDNVVAIAVPPDSPAHQSFPCAVAVAVPADRSRVPRGNIPGQFHHSYYHTNAGGTTAPPVGIRQSNGGYGRTNRLYLAANGRDF
jgi:hypothetical protein